MGIWGSKVLIVTLALFSAILLAANGALAGQANSYTETNFVDGQCEQATANTAQSCGFTNIAVNQPTVSFNSGAYECAARCVTKHNIVFMYCFGPSSSQAHEIVEYMKKNGQWMQ